MAMYPEAQQKAQEELDRVIGRSRLPDFTDKDQLSYVNALCNEVLRWRPVLPVSIPHRVMEDDEYRGMHIPKNSIVISVLWYDLCAETR
jgi:cytochrome P450